MKSIVLIGADGRQEVVPFVSASAPGFGEAWIQEKVFEVPQLVPSELLDSSTDVFVPVCRELPLDGMFLDVFGATSSGTPVLIECKLWKNPEARRKVIGQILDYSASLEGLTYEDVTAICRRTLKASNEDPILESARRTLGEIDEARFVDRFSECLARGDFILIIAGDGIRAEVRRVVDQLQRKGVFRRLGTLELKVARTEGGAPAAVPIVPFRADRPTLSADAGGAPVVGSAEDGAGQPARAGDPEGVKADRAFWDRFIAEAKFDYADQPRPVHGSRNWVRLSLAKPVRWMVAYRARQPSQVGVFVKFRTDAELGVFAALREDEADLREELGPDLALQENKDGSATIELRHFIDIEDSRTSAAQLEWLEDASNRFLNALRPRISRLEAD